MRKFWSGPWKTEPACRAHTRTRHRLIADLLRTARNKFEQNNFKEAERLFRLARTHMRKQFIEATTCVAKGAMYPDYAFKFVVPIASKFVEFEKEFEGD